MNPPAPTARRTLLILSQVFVPDPASVGQHVADVALEMARRGHRVIVYTSRRGYENPANKYPARENIGGVEVHRLPFCSFGKKYLPVRVMGTMSFMIQAFLVSLWPRRVDALFFSTSPPLIGFVACVAAMVRGVPTAYWAMDLNPDQLIAMGRVRPDSRVARLLERINRFILRRASLIVALDRFMAQRLRGRADIDGKLLVMPPWPHEDHIQSVEPQVNPFVAAHGLTGKFVIMYSGNHSPANPLSTLLRAALSFKDDPDVRFLFVGGGLGKREVESFIAEHGLKNVQSLPYQPLAELGRSLSAADVHVVSLGDSMVGIIHPCKIYGAMAIARPILFLGPTPSHVTDLLDQHRLGWRVGHGDDQGAIDAIARMRSMPRQDLRDMGLRAQVVLREQLSQELLCRRLADALERIFRPR